MLTFLPGPLVAIFGLLAYLFVTATLGLTVLILLVLRYLMPTKSMRQTVDRWAREWCFDSWGAGCSAVTRLITTTQWDIQGTGKLDRATSYFLVSNHQSWLDILLLEQVFSRKVPTLKFFMKQELLWTIPVAGLACRAVGFPFMKRYSKAYLKKHPEKKGKDIEITRKSCEQFKHQPVTMVNYIEGTRYTPEKSKRQASPYRHLLKPKTGTFGFVIRALDGQIQEVINTTIIYPANISLWDFACNRVKRIAVRYEVVSIPNELRGLQDERQFKIGFQQWINQLWKEKDQLIEQASPD